MPPAKSLSFTVAPEDAGERLDRWLARHIGDLSRARLQSLIRDGHVRAGRALAGEPSRNVKAGETYEIQIPDAEDAGVKGETIALDVVFEDAHVIVIDKPAGMVVHPAAGHASGTLVNALIAHCGESLSGVGGVKRPGIVHRIDKDTSGLLVVAKNDAAHASLSEQFKSHGLDGRLSRVYLAFVWGVPERRSGKVEAPLTRSDTNRTKIAIARGMSGRHAVTHYRVVETFNAPGKNDVAALLELELETGRTHQIRVHLAHIGHPLLGDQVYGAGFKSRANLLSEAAQAALTALGRQALHAAKLGFEHPKSAKSLAFESPLPEDIQLLADALRARPARPLAPAKAKGRKLARR